MWGMSIVCLLFLVSAAFAVTDEEVKGRFVQQIMKCTKTHQVEMSDLIELERKIVPKKPEVKCLLACAYRLDGTMNAKGFYDYEVGYKMAEEAKNGDEQRLAKAKKLVEVCTKVNDVKVSDGEKGCERAALMFKCVVDNAPKLGFKT